MTDVDITELIDLEAERVSGVTHPANGTHFLVMKSESQESDHLTELVSGEKPAGAKCNAPTADGSPCARSPVAGSNRCHHHPGVVLKEAGAQMDDVKLARLAALCPVLRRNSAVRMAAQGELYKAAKAMTPEPGALDQVLADAEAAVAKGDIQDALNGTATPETYGSFASGGSGVSGPSTGPVRGGLGTQAANGLPGVTGPLQGGQSAYTVPAEDRLNGDSAAPAGTSLGRAAIVAAMTGRPQELPDAPTPANYVKKEIQPALEDWAAKDRAYKSVVALGDARLLGNAAEALTLAKLRAHASIQRAVQMAGRP